MDSVRGYTSLLLIAGASVIWGFLGLCIRALSDAGLSSLQMFELRCIICTVVIGAIILIKDKNLFKISKRDVKLLVLIGIVKIAADTCYFQAQLMVDLSLAAVLENTEPYFVAIMSYFIFRERLSSMQKLSLVVAFAGCVLVSGILGGVDATNPLGILVGLISGITFAIYTVGVKDAVKRGCDSSTILFYIFLVCSICTFPFCEPVSMFEISFSGTDVMVNILLLGIVFTLIPYYMHALCLKDLSATTSSVVLFLEVVTCAIVGYFFYGEVLDAFNIIGMALVFIGIVMINRPSDADTAYDDRRSSRG